jgi:hypothetical protein
MVGSPRASTFDGDPGRIRTCDFQLRRLALFSSEWRCPPSAGELRHSVGRALLKGRRI